MEGCRMTRIKWILYQNSLVIKIFLVLLVSILVVTLLLVFSNMRMSSKLFMDTFSITNTKAINQINHRYFTFSNSIVSAKMAMEQNSVIKQQLKEEHDSSLEEYEYFYTVDQEMDKLQTHSHDDATIVLLTNRSEIFNSNFGVWTVDGNRLADSLLKKQVDQGTNKIQFFYENSELTNHHPMIITGTALQD